MCQQSHSTTSPSFHRARLMIHFHPPLHSHQVLSLFLWLAAFYSFESSPFASLSSLPPSGRKMTYPSTGLGPARALQLHKDRDIPRLYSEPLDSDGIVPVRFQKALVISFPILEIIQRCLHRLPINGNLDTVIALITLYQIARPAWDIARSLFIRFATSSISIAEHDPVAKEVIAWMSANVM